MKKNIKSALFVGLSFLLLATALITFTPTVVLAQQSVDNTAKINDLMKEKQELIIKKKASRNRQEQKSFGIRIGEIEREIQELKCGQKPSTHTGEARKQIESSTKETNATAQIDELIKKKQELIDKKKVSRNKKEQKKLGEQIKEIARQIKQLKKNKS